MSTFVDTLNVFNTDPFSILTVHMSLRHVESDCGLVTAIAPFPQHVLVRTGAYWDAGAGGSSHLGDGVHVDQTWHRSTGD